MAEIRKKTTHRKAKGTGNNGRTGRQKPRRPRATAKAVRKREKTPQAKAARKKTARASGDEDLSEKRGIDGLKKAIDSLLKARPEEIAEFILNHAKAGNSAFARLFTVLGEQYHPENPATSSSTQLFEELEHLTKEPAHENGAEQRLDVSQSASDPDVPNQALVVI